MEYWSGVKFWSGKSTCMLLIKLCILCSGVLEQSIGVESDFGVAKVEWSAVVMCVCHAPKLLSKTPLHRIHGALLFWVCDQALRGLKMEL